MFCTNSWNSSSKWCHGEVGKKGGRKTSVRTPPLLVYFPTPWLSLLCVFLSLIQDQNEQPRAFWKGPDIFLEGAFLGVFSSPSPCGLHCAPSHKMGPTSWFGWECLKAGFWLNGLLQVFCFRVAGVFADFGARFLSFVGWKVPNSIFQKDPWWNPSKCKAPKIPNALLLTVQTKKWCPQMQTFSLFSYHTTVSALKQTCWRHVEPLVKSVVAPSSFGLHPPRLSAIFCLVTDMRFTCLPDKNNGHII